MVKLGDSVDGFESCRLQLCVLEVCTVQGKDVFQDADGGCGGLARSNLFQRSCLETRRSLLCGTLRSFTPEHSPKIYLANEPLKLEPWL